MSAVGAYGEFALLAARYPVGHSETGAQRFASLAWSAYRRGHESLAERSLRRAVDLAPHSAELYTWLGSLEYQRGKVDAARESFEHALDLDPNADDALFGIAASLHALGRVSDSIYYYLSYLQAHPDSVPTLIYLAGAYQATGQPAEAVDHFERAIALEPDDPEVHGLYGRALFELGRVEEGRRHLQRAIELGSVDSEVHRVLGLSLEATGEVGEARTELERALASDPDNLAARIELATKLLEEHKPEEALDHARRAAELAKDDQRPAYEKSAAFWLLGWSYYTAGQWRKSEKASRSALEVDPTLVPVRFNLGLALLRQGRADEARAEYREAADMIDEAWDLRVAGMEDLRAALKDEPDLPGGREILAFLDERYERLSTKRSGSLPG